jgi:hypothetical protein
MPKQDWFSLFFPEPLNNVDWGNLQTSGVRRVQLFFRTALNRPNQLQQLASMGVRVVLRLEEPGQDEPLNDTYYGAGAPGRIRGQLLQLMQLVQVEGVIVGNEPEQPYDLTWKSPNWGNNPDGKWPIGKAWHHARAFDEMRQALGDLPVRIVSPGWTCQRLTPNDRPQPGRATWARICADPYNGTFIRDPAVGAKLANGVHIYVLNWLGEEDFNRFRWGFGNELERCHRAVWINECNTNSGPPVERMRAVLSMADLVRAHPDGNRVESFCPFVSNGLGNHFPAGYIMRDRACYELLSAWMVQ